MGAHQPWLVQDSGPIVVIDENKTYIFGRGVVYPFPIPTFTDPSVLFPSEAAKLWRAVLSMKGAKE
jgi:hypothetical protein